MSRTKNGFSTGKGFLTTVDNATNAVNTSLTNGEWTAKAADDIYLDEGKTYQIKFCYSEVYFQYIVYVDNVVTTWLPETKVGGTATTIKPYIEMQEVSRPLEDPLILYRFNGTINDDFALIDNVTNVYIRELK